MEHNTIIYKIEMICNLTPNFLSKIQNGNQVVNFNLFYIFNKSELFSFLNTYKQQLNLSIIDYTSEI